MTTQQAIEALHALPRMGQGEPGLARMQNLCDHLDNPEKELQCIHIAGTNGKGSLAAMTSSILTAAGYKTGLTISPYVVDFRERFQIDGEIDLAPHAGQPDPEGDGRRGCHRGRGRRKAGGV